MKARSRGRRISWVLLLAVSLIALGMPASYGLPAATGTAQVVINSGELSQLSDRLTVVAGGSQGVVYLRNPTLAKSNLNATFIGQLVFLPAEGSAQVVGTGYVDSPYSLAYPMLTAFDPRHLGAISWWNLATRTSGYTPIASSDRYLAASPDGFVYASTGDTIVDQPIGGTAVPLGVFPGDPEGPLDLIGSSASNGIVVNSLDGLGAYYIAFATPGVLTPLDLSKVLIAPATSDGTALFCGGVTATTAWCGGNYEYTNSQDDDNVGPLPVALEPLNGSTPTVVGPSMKLGFGAGDPASPVADGGGSLFQLGAGGKATVTSSSGQTTMSGTFTRVLPGLHGAALDPTSATTVVYRPAPGTQRVLVTPYRSYAGAIEFGIDGDRIAWVAAGDDAKHPTRSVIRTRSFSASPSVLAVSVKAATIAHPTSVPSDVQVADGRTVALIDGRVKVYAAHGVRSIGSHVLAFDFDGDRIAYSKGLAGQTLSIYNVSTRKSGVVAHPEHSGIFRYAITGKELIVVLNNRHVYKRTIGSGGWTRLPVPSKSEAESVVAGGGYVGWNYAKLGSYTGAYESATGSAVKTLPTGTSIVDLSTGGALVTPDEDTGFNQLVDYGWVARGTTTTIPLFSDLGTPTTPQLGQHVVAWIDGQARLHLMALPTG